MATQPSYRPFRESKFFSDRRSSRPLVPGTIARGSKIDTGLKTLQPGDWAQMAGMVGNVSAAPLTAANGNTKLSAYLDVFPEPITYDTLEQGRQRYDIFCSACHDRVGTGNGMIVQRGFTRPPSFHTDLSRGFKYRGMEVPLTDVPVGYYFEVITNGFGAMADYSVQVEPKDRWAIIAYIRALQFSQRASLADVADDAEKKRLQSLRGNQP